ncbi:uncharacterized protein [Physcomitrium patens]|nr:uncharacterized protein LOC112285865 [Physcomitrium patens]|eukprot:XP_024382941.1 uncharacterized protein LOC112285865 [Physcomitrella patens]
MRLEPQPSLSILPSPSLSERRGELPSTTIAMLSGMVQFPVLVPPTVDQSDDWLIAHDSETQLAQEEQELEEKWAEIRTTNQDVNPLGKSTLENHEEDYVDAEDEDADNGEEGSEVEEFEQEAN